MGLVSTGSGQKWDRSGWASFRNWTGQEGYRPGMGLVLNGTDQELNWSGIGLVKMGLVRNGTSELKTNLYYLKNLEYLMNLKLFAFVHFL